MAKLYGEIDAKALLTLDKSFARANGQPLDASEVYYSKAAAETYAKTAQAYIGQKIVVIENGIVTHYSVETTDGTLKELGSKPVADGTTVAIDETTGKITLANIAESNKTGTYNAVLVNGVLTWVKPSETTVEGLSDLIAALTTRVTTAETDIDALQAAVGVAAKDAEGNEGDADYKPAVAATGLHKAIADEITRATAAEQALSNKIGTASKPESAEGAGDGTAATGIIADIENLQNTKANISYVDSEISGLEEAISKLNHFTTKIVSSVDEVTETGVLYLIKDETVTGVDKYNEYLYIETSGIGSPVLIGDTTTDLSNYYNKTQVDNVISPITEDLDDLAERVKTLEDTDNATQEEFDAYKGEVAEQFSTLETSLYEGSYTKKDSETGETVTITSNIATADQDASRLITPSEIAKLSALVLSEDGSVGVSGTISADNVTGFDTKVESVVTGSNALNIERGAEVNIIEQIKVNNTALVPDENRAVNITVPTKFSDLTDDSGFDARITAAQQRADKGVSDASTAQTTANEAKAAAENNATTIGGISTTVAGHTTTINSHESKISQLEEGQTSLTSSYNTLNGIVSGHTSAIASKAEQTALDTAVSNIATNTTAINTLNNTTIPGLEATINNKANKSDVYTKTQIGILAQDSDGNDKTIVQMIADAQAAATYDDSAIKADLTKLIGDDKDTSGKATKSIRAIANEEAVSEVTKIVNGAPAALDTLKEIADWIIDDNTGSAAVVEDIAKHDAILDGFGGTDEPATVFGFVEQQIAAIPLATLVTGENTVTATKGLILPEQSMFEMTDGKVTAVSTDLLTQGKNTLILNGGSANT